MLPSKKVKLEGSANGNGGRSNDGIKNEIQLTIHFFSAAHGKTVYKGIASDVKIKSIIDLWQETYIVEDDEHAIVYVYGTRPININDHIVLEQASSKSIVPSLIEADPDRYAPRADPSLSSMLRLFLSVGSD